MCVGDSITAGSREFPVYRSNLLEQLQNAGFFVEYVGSQQSSDYADWPHEGYGSHTAEMILPKVISNYSQYIADIVLIHAGHNHFNEESPVNGIADALSEMIKAFRRINPQVIVLLAKVITSGKLPKYSYIPALNSQIEHLCRSLQTVSIPLICVDQSDGWDHNIHTCEDRVHPNELGARKMADCWFQSLKPVLINLITSLKEKVTNNEYH